MGCPLTWYPDCSVSVPVPQHTLLGLAPLPSPSPRSLCVLQPPSPPELCLHCFPNTKLCLSSWLWTGSRRATGSLRDGGKTRDLYVRERQTDRHQERCSRQKEVRREVQETGVPCESRGRAQGGTLCPEGTSGQAGFAPDSPLPLPRRCLLGGQNPGAVSLSTDL